MAVGSLTNLSKIAATFKSKLHSDISINTIRQYIAFLQDAFVIHEAHHFDVKGRKYIGSPLKYYFEDVGLRNARLGFRQHEETHLMENMLYNELSPLKLTAAEFKAQVIADGTFGMRRRA